MDMHYRNPLVYETAIRLDGKLKHHFISMISKDLTDYCCKFVKSETDTVRAILGTR